VSTSRAGGPRPEASPARGKGTDDAGVESNARLTAMTAAVLLVLLAVEGVTLLRVHSLLWLHVFLGTALVPPVLLKIGSTCYRFARYYLGAPAYRRKGPPPPVLRVLGPLVVIATLTLLGSGIVLMFVGVGSRQPWLLLHKASFVIWFAAMVFHVLGHLLETARLAPRDWLDRAHSDIAGARWRQWGVAASVALGVPLGLLLIARANSWFGPPFFH
jgi:hypothetical protein